MLKDSKVAGRALKIEILVKREVWSIDRNHNQARSPSTDVFKSVLSQTFLQLCQALSHFH